MVPRRRRRESPEDDTGETTQNFSFSLLAFLAHPFAGQEPAGLSPFVKAHPRTSGYTVGDANSPQHGQHMSASTSVSLRLAPSLTLSCPLRAHPPIVRFFSTLSLFPFLFPSCTINPPRRRLTLRGVYFPWCKRSRDWRCVLTVLPQRFHNARRRHRPTQLPSGTRDRHSHALRRDRRRQDREDVHAPLSSRHLGTRFRARGGERVYPRARDVKTRRK